MLTGIDISNYQAGLSGSVVAQADVVVVKATEGIGFKDPHLFDLFSKAVNAGKKAGAYHFWRPGSSGVAQADYFVDYVNANGLTLDFAVLDFEDERDLANESGAIEFMRRVQERLGVPVWFYVYVSPLKTYGYWKVRKDFKIWLAGYLLGEQPIHGFTPPMTLDEYIIFNGIDSRGIDFAGWQYTPAGRLPGYSGNLDLNTFFEDAFVGGDAPSIGIAKTMTIEPVSGFPVTQNFGDGKGLLVNGVATNVGGGHTGIDYATPVGTPAVALESGTVLYAGWAKDLPRTSWADRWYLGGGGFGGLAIDSGLIIVIQHPGYITVYAHMNEIALNVGDRVEQLQIVGKTGATGYVSGPHLHFEVLPTPTAYATAGNGSMIFGRVDPRPYFTQTIENPDSLKGDWLSMATAEDVYKQVTRAIEEAFTPGKAGVKTAGVPYLHLARIEEKVDKVQERLNIVWGGIFTDFSYSGKPGTNEPGIIKLLKSNAGAVSGLEAKLQALGAVAQNGGVVTTGAVSAVTGISEERLREIVAEEVGSLALVKKGE